jgi:3-dehydroquinate synthase
MASTEHTTAERQQLNVALPDGRSYPIIIEAGVRHELMERLPELLPGVDRLGIVTSKTVYRHWEEYIQVFTQMVPVPMNIIMIDDGEEAKTLDSLAEIYDVMLSAGISRQSALLAFSGGVVGDTAGFAAATLLRGIRFIQLPTTLLSMVDSSVGGKTGINHTSGKNLIGSFHQPEAVFIDPELLDSLPPEEFRAGMAEVVKYGVIKDAAFFEYLEQNIDAIMAREAAPLVHILKRSVEIKAEVVAADEREQGLRAILNFGHTIGHALEAVTNYSRFRHGEAIALGMIAAARLGTVVGRDTCADIEKRLIALFEKIGLPTKLDQLEPESILTPMQKDKKVRDGKIRFILPVEMGKVEIASDITTDQILKATESIT